MVEPTPWNASSLVPRNRSKRAHAFWFRMMHPIPEQKCRENRLPGWNLKSPPFGGATGKTGASRRRGWNRERRKAEGGNAALNARPAGVGSRQRMEYELIIVIMRS